MSTYEEWRVTGTPRLLSMSWNFPDEAEARRFISNAIAPSAWTDGPHLHKRTVTVTDWTEVDA
jgi:hypothetical protein